MCQIETKMATSFIIILFPVFVQNDAAQLGNNAIKMQLKMSKYFIFVWGIMIGILNFIFYFFSMKGEMLPFLEDHYICIFELSFLKG